MDERTLKLPYNESVPWAHVFVFVYSFIYTVFIEIGKAGTSCEHNS